LENRLPACEGRQRFQPVRQWNDSLDNTDDGNSEIYQSLFECLKCHGRSLRNQNSTIVNRLSESAGENQEIAKFAPKIQRVPQS
jgi:hypothetical protein